LAIVLVSFLLGLILMVIWWLRSPAFFRLRPGTLPDDAAVPPAATGAQ
jgi:hypothetical protein